MFALFSKWATKYSNNCLFHEMGKFFAYFMKWAKLLPISTKWIISQIGRNIYISISYV